MPKYSVRKICGSGIPVHRDAIVALWKNNLKAASYPGRFEWFYEQNPEGYPLTWLALEAGSGTAVGCNSLFPRALQVQGEKLTIGIAADFAINAQHRVFGPALQIQRDIVSQSPIDGFDFNFAYPNASGSAVFLRAGYRELGESVTYVKVLKTKAKLKRIIAWDAASSVAGAIADVALRLIDTAVMFTLPRRYVTDTVVSYDDRFDTLWDEARASYPVIGEKSSVFLNWRYGSAQAEAFQCFCLRDSRDLKLHGFVVYAVRNGVATIFDFFALRNTATMATLLLRFARDMRTKCIDAIVLSYVGENAFKHVLRRAGFIARNQRRKCLVFLKDDTLAKTILDGNNWFLFDGEMDL